MICVDIDGTLTNSEKKISHKTKSEIDRVVDDYGVEFVLVSARTPTALHLLSDELGLSHPVLIGINGALVVQVNSDTGHQDVLFSKTISKEDCRVMIDYAQEHNIYLAIFCENDWYTDHQDYWADREATNNGVPYKIMSWGDMRKNNVEPYKLMIRSHDVGEIARMMEYLESKNLTSTTIHLMSKGTLIEPTPSGVDKETAIRFVCEKKNINIDEVLAFGDGRNDLPMLECAGCGVAMGNAPDDVKAKSNEVTLSNDEDGIAVTLTKYFPK